MNNKKLISYIIGGTFAIAVILGIILMLSPKATAIPTAIVIICLSLASGLLIPNPISFVGLLAGICMLVFPNWVVGVIFITAGIVGAVINIFTAKKHIN